MRIECQKCAAAYAIDDRLVTPKGVRAQCPRCRHLQLVKPEGAAESASSAPAAAALDVEAPLPKPSAPKPAAASFNPIDELLGPPSPQVLAGPGAASAPEAGRLPLPARVVPCNSCGKPLTDSFDQALGLCDGCRTQRSGRPIVPEFSTEPELAPAAPEASAPQPTAPEPAPPAPALTAAAEPAASPRPFKAQMFSAAYEDEPEPRRPSGQMIGLGVIGLVVILTAVVLVIKRPWVDEAPPLAVQVEAGPIDEVIRQWKLRFVELGGSASEHLKEGATLLAQDTTSGYADAEEEFQKALILDSSSDLAVAGYARALALGRGARVDEKTYQEALGLVASAEARSGGAPGVLIAHAELLLTRPTPGNASDARALAERAIAAGAPEEKAQAHLAVGHSYLSTNGVWASEAFEKALAIAPELKRGYYYRAQIFASTGEYRKAIQNLEKRLELDPDQWEAADALARFYVEIGEIELAQATFRRSIEASRYNARAKLSLAVLAYQHQGRHQEAIDALKLMVAEREKYEDRDVVEVLVHLATAERLLGQSAAAQQDVNDALAMAASDPAAHLQAFLLALEREATSQAKPHLPYLTGHLGDAGLEKLLEGRLLLADGRWEEAITALTKAQELDPRRTDALILAGAAAAQARNEEKAYELVLRRALSADPGRSGPRPVLSRYYLSPSDVLGPAVGKFQPLSTGKEDPNPDLCEGLVRFFLGALPEADKHLAKVVAIDDANAPAFSLRSLIAQARGDKAQAQKLAGRAVDADRQLALSHLAAGTAAAALGKAELATKELRASLAQDPKLLGPRVKLGEVLRVRQPDEARKLLLTVVGLDDTYPGAKRALYLLAE